mmetsp:Transcript_77172/g.226364  ORF Transcript_77172/g.226364 Transcript_77172/m.226364 type:complete len:468 (+) Transcript_77172:466-1869(+)
MMLLDSLEHLEPENGPLVWVLLTQHCRGVEVLHELLVTLETGIAHGWNLCHGISHEFAPEATLHHDVELVHVAGRGEVHEGEAREDVAVALAGHVEERVALRQAATFQEAQEVLAAGRSTETSDHHRGPWVVAAVCGVDVVLGELLRADLRAHRPVEHALALGVAGLLAGAQGGRQRRLAASETALLRREGGARERRQALAGRLLGARLGVQLGQRLGSELFGDLLQPRRRRRHRARVLSSRAQWTHAAGAPDARGPIVALVQQHPGLRTVASHLEELLRCAHVEVLHERVAAAHGDVRHLSKLREAPCRDHERHLREEPRHVHANDAAVVRHRRKRLRASRHLGQHLLRGPHIEVRQQHALLDQAQAQVGPRDVADLGKLRHELRLQRLALPIRVRDADGVGEPSGPAAFQDLQVAALEVETPVADPRVERKIVHLDCNDGLDRPDRGLSAPLSLVAQLRSSSRAS